MLGDLVKEALEPPFVFHPRFVYTSINQATVSVSKIGGSQYWCSYLVP